MSLQKKRKVNCLSNVYSPNSKRIRINENHESKKKEIFKYDHDSCHDIQNYDAWDEMFSDLKQFFDEDKYNYNVTDKNIIKIITEYSVGNIDECGNDDCLKELLIIDGINNKLPNCDKCNQIYFCNDNCTANMKCNNCDKIYCDIEGCFSENILHCDICEENDGCINPDCDAPKNITKCSGFDYDAMLDKQQQARDEFGMEIFVDERQFECKNYLCDTCARYCNCYLCINKTDKLCHKCDKLIRCIKCYKIVCRPHVAGYKMCTKCKRKRREMDDYFDLQMIFSQNNSNRNYLDIFFPLGINLNTCKVLKFNFEK